MKSFYRPHKMALWNNLVPDLVKLAEREMDVAIDKLPHSRFPSAASPGDSDSNLINDGTNLNHDGTLKGDSSSTYGIDGSKGIPVSVVIIVGMILLMLNVCACVGVIYQKSRVRQREDTLRRHIHRLSDAGVIHSASVLGEEDGTENIAGNGIGPYCISSPPNEDMTQNTYGPDPVKSNACTTSDHEDGSESEQDEHLSDEELFRMKQPHPIIPTNGMVSHPIQHNFYHQPLSNKQKVGSLKSALRKPTKSNEMLFQSLPDRSELHRHSKSIPNFDEHPFMHPDRSGHAEHYRNAERYSKPPYYNYPPQQQQQPSHYNVPRNIYNTQRPPMLQHQHSLQHHSQQQQQQLPHYQQPSPYIISSSNHDTSFSSNRTSIQSGSINSSTSGIPNETYRSKSTVAINTAPGKQEMKMYYPSLNAMSGHVSDSVTDGSSVSIRQQQNRPRLLGLPKVLPDLPGACHNLASTAKKKVIHDGERDDDSDRIPSPIIEIIPMSEYGPMYPSTNHFKTSSASSASSSLQRPVASSNNPNFMNSQNYVVVSQSFPNQQQNSTIILNPAPPFQSNQQRQPLYSGAVYPLYQASGLSTSHVGPTNHHSLPTSTNLVPNYRPRPPMYNQNYPNIVQNSKSKNLNDATTHQYQPKMVAFKSPIASSSPIEKKLPPIEKDAPLTLSKEENIPMIQRRPPQLHPSIEESTHVPIYSLQQQHSVTPSNSSNEATDIDMTSNSRENNDSIYGFVPKPNFGSNNPKKKIEFDLKSGLSADKENQSSCPGIQQTSKEKATRTTKDGDIGVKTESTLHKQNEEILTQHRESTNSAEIWKPMKSVIDEAHNRSEKGSLLAETIPSSTKLPAIKDNTREENCSDEISPSLITSFHSSSPTISKDEFEGKSMVHKNEPRTIENEEGKKVKEKNISMNEEQLETTFEGQIYNSIEQKELSEPRNDSIECNTNSSPKAFDSRKQSYTEDPYNETLRDFNLDALKDNEKETQLHIEGSKERSNQQCKHPQFNEKSSDELLVPNNCAKDEMCEQHDNSNSKSKVEQTKNSSPFSLSNKGSAIKRNAPAMVMSLFGKKSAPHKDNVRPSLHPKPTTSSPPQETALVRTDEGCSSSKNVNPTSNVGSYDNRDNFPNKRGCDANNKENVNASGTSSTLIPNVRGPVWQAFVASNSNNNTLTNNSKGGSSISDNETSKMPLASPTSTENWSDDISSSSNKSSETMSSPLSKNALGDPMDNNNMKKCNENINKSSTTTDGVLDDSLAANISSKCNNTNNTDSMSFSTMSSINNNESEYENHVHILTPRGENSTNEKVVENKFMAGQLQHNPTLNKDEIMCSSTTPLATSAPLASDEEGDSTSLTNDLSSSTYTSQQTTTNDQDIFDEDVGRITKGQNEHLFVDATNKTPVLRKIGEKTPPGTLKRKENNVTDGTQPSAKSWCTQYSQAFLSKTIETEPPSIDIDFVYPSGDNYQLEEEDPHPKETLEEKPLPPSDDAVKTE